MTIPVVTVSGTVVDIKSKKIDDPKNAILVFQVENTYVVDGKEYTSCFECKALKNRAIELNEKLRVGRQVSVQGYLVQETWMSDGVTLSRVRVYVW